MTEYIFDVPDENQPIAGESSVYYPDERDAPMIVREEIVRCRDCEHFDIKRDGCWWFAHAERQPDYSWADEPSDVEPDGFCAWAKRKEGGE